MTYFKLNRLTFSVVCLIFPVLVSCSVLSGVGLSDDPIVAEQQRKIESLKTEAQRAEQEVEDAEEREKAAKSRLKAAEDELRVLKTEAKRRAGSVPAN